MAEKKKKTENFNAVVKGQRKITNNVKDECNFNFKEWKIVLQCCTSMFNGKKLSNSDFVKMFETIRSIANTEVGQSYLLSKNYEETILRRGMIILRDEMKEKPGHAYLVKLSEVWTNFYQNILPTLQLLFGCIPTHGMTVKQMTVASFRDTVVLKLKVDEALSANDQSVPKPLKQMFCILLLQASHDNSENYSKLEALASRVINPFLGSKGLHIRSEVKEPLQEKKTSDRFTSNAISSVENSPEIQAKNNHDSSDADFEELMNFRREKFNRFGRGGPQRLSCVDESREGISESLASLIADGFELG